MCSEYPRAIVELMKSLCSLAVGSTFDFLGKGVRTMVFFVDKLICSIQFIAPLDAWMKVLYFVMIIAPLRLFFLNSKPADSMIGS